MGICWRENKNKLEKDAFFCLFMSVIQRKNSESPWGIALPLSHRNSTVSEVYHEVHMTRVLSTARISNVNRNWEIVKFELGKDIEKNAFFASHARDKTKTKNISLHLYRAQNLSSPSFYLRINCWIKSGGWCHGDQECRFERYILCSRVLRLSELPRFRERRQSVLCC